MSGRNVHVQITVPGPSPYLAATVADWVCSQFRIDDGVVLLFDAVPKAGNPNDPIPLLAYFASPGVSVTFSEPPGPTT